MLVTVAAWGNLLFVIAVIPDTGQDIAREITARRLSLSHQAMAVYPLAPAMAINLENRVLGAVRSLAMVGCQRARVMLENLTMVEAAHN